MVVERARAARYPGSRIDASASAFPSAFARDALADSGNLEEAPRLQWRHRVGFAPTSHDRRRLSESTTVF